MTTAPAALRVSALREADIEPVVALARETWYLHYPGIITVAQIDYMLAQRYAPQAIRAQLGSAASWWDKIEADGVLAGFAQYEADAGQRRAKLDELYVHPRFQGRGVGSALLAHVEQACAARGFERLWLQVNKHNAKAIAAYRRNGYAVAESVKVEIGNGFVMDDYIMEKAIAGSRLPQAAGQPGGNAQHSAQTQ